MDPPLPGRAAPGGSGSVRQLYGVVLVATRPASSRSPAFHRPGASGRVAVWSAANPRWAPAGQDQARPNRPGDQPGRASQGSGPGRSGKNSPDAPRSAELASGIPRHLAGSGRDVPCPSLSGAAVMGLAPWWVCPTRPQRGDCQWRGTAVLWSESSRRGHPLAWRRSKRPQRAQVGSSLTKRGYPTGYPDVPQKPLPAVERQISLTRVPRSTGRLKGPGLPARSRLSLRLFVRLRPDRDLNRCGL